MYIIANYLPAEAIDAILAQGYLGTPTCSRPRDKQGRCALAVGLQSLGLRVGNAPRSVTLALALSAQRAGRTRQYNRHHGNPLWRFLERRKHTEHRAVEEAAWSFVANFDGGNIRGEKLFAALGRPVPQPPVRQPLRPARGVRKLTLTLDARGQTVATEQPHGVLVA